VETALIGPCRRLGELVAMVVVGCPLLIVGCALAIVGRAPVSVDCMMVAVAWASAVVGCAYPGCPLRLATT
jgi:hypothetical protein